MHCVLKSALGLNKFSRSTPLLEALKINKINSSLETQQLNLLKSIINNGSRARTFYLYILKQHMIGKNDKHRDLISRLKPVCAKYDISLIQYIFNDHYSNSCKRTIKAFKTNDGLIDSIPHQLYNCDRTVINLLLSHF